MILGPEGDHVGDSDRSPESADGLPELTGDNWVVLKLVQAWRERLGGLVKTAATEMFAESQPQVSDASDSAPEKNVDDQSSQSPDQAPYYPLGDSNLDKDHGQ